MVRRRSSATIRTFYITDHYASHPVVLVRLARIQRDQIRDESMPRENSSASDNRAVPTAIVNSTGCRGRGASFLGPA